MGKRIDTNSLEWQPVRPELTSGVTGKLLRDGSTRIVLTRVEPGGSFPAHVDDYAHQFHFLSGSGVVQLEEQQLDVGPGVSVQVDAGELHGYENSGEDDLILISMNLKVD